MTDEDYAFNLKQVKRALIKMADQYPLLPGLVYTSPYDFVSRHGVDYRPNRIGRLPYTQGVAAQCYGNAISLAGKEDLKYVEGFAMAPNGHVIPHGWNLDDEGLVDVTWMNTGLIYLGVEFSLERGDDATWNGDAHVLNDEHRNYPIFQKIWQGEDYSIVWPQSDRVDALRRYRVTGYYEEPASVTAWLKGQQ